MLSCDGGDNRVRAGQGPAVTEHLSRGRTAPRSRHRASRTRPGRARGPSAMRGRCGQGAGRGGGEGPAGATAAAGSLRERRRGGAGGRVPGARGAQAAASRRQPRRAAGRAEAGTAAARPLSAPRRGSASRCRQLPRRSGKDLPEPPPRRGPAVPAGCGRCRREEEEEEGRTQRPVAARGGVGAGARRRGVRVPPASRPWGPLGWRDRVACAPAAGAGSDRTRPRAGVGSRSPQRSSRSGGRR